MGVLWLRRTVSEIEEVLVAAIKPFVGEVMAPASVKSFVKKLGLSARIAVADRAKLIDAVGLNVFIGKTKTAEVLAGLRAKLLKERPRGRGSATPCCRSPSSCAPRSWWRRSATTWRS